MIVPNCLGVFYLRLNLLSVSLLISIIFNFFSFAGLHLLYAREPIITQAVAALIGIFVGFTVGILVAAISGTVFLWLYGSFWTTLLVIFLGGVPFISV